MRVLMFNPSFPPMACGVGHYVARLAEELASEGHAVRVVTSVAVAGAPAPERVRLLPFAADWDVISFVRAFRRFGRERPDLVISQYPSLLPGRRARLLFLLPALAKLTLGRPRTVIVVHEFAETERAAQHWLRLAFAAADRVVAVSELEAAAIRSRYPWTDGKLAVIPIGSSVPAHRAEDAAGFEKNRRRPLLMHFGLPTPAKGIAQLLEAMAPRPWDLVATGRLDLGDEHQRALAERISELGLEDRVRWLGYLDDEQVAEQLHGADAVVLPFRRGAVANNSSLLAALVSGAAVVTTSGAGSPTWLEDGRNVVIAGDTPEALRAGIERALADPAPLRAGAAALAARFDWAEIARRIAAPR